MSAGNLRRLFVGDEAALERNLAELDTAPDADGRFRINAFFCHADTWQRVLSRLVKTTDVVLMDLRSFSANNDGCVFEIEELLNAVPLERLVFVIDETTDRKFLGQTVAEVYRELRDDSPNRGASLSTLRTFELNSARANEVRGLLKALRAACRSGASMT